MRYWLVAALVIAVSFFYFDLKQYVSSFLKIYLQHYVSKQISDLGSEVDVSFKNFNFTNHGNYALLQVFDVNISSENQSIASAEKVEVKLDLGFFFTKIKPTDILVKNAIFNINIKNDDNIEIDRKKIFDKLFSIKNLFGVEVEIENLEFNNQKVSRGILQFKTKKKGKNNQLDNQRR